MIFSLIKHRIFPSRDHIRFMRKVFSDFIHRRHPFSWVILKNCLIVYFTGSYSHYIVEIEKTLSEPLPLYHAAYSSLIPELQKNGIRAKDFVFLTDSANYSIGYWGWKDKEKNRAKGTHIIVKIDTAKLLDSGHPVCKLKNKNEYITDCVPPCCISSISVYPESRE